MSTNIESLTAGTPSVVSKAAEQFQGLFDVILVKVTLDEDTIAAQVGSQADITVPGVALGDFVFVSTGVDNAGLLVQAFVRAANSITVTAYNIEGTDAVTALSGAVEANILVLKPKGSWGKA